MCERKRFEAWARKQGYSLAVTPKGLYCSDYTQSTWEAWQAACPEGWQCVPSNLITKEMRRRSYYYNDFIDGGSGSIDEFNSAIYFAMLAAAPKPEDFDHEQFR